jgi:phospholipid transport system substrate-binding protein
MADDAQPTLASDAKVGSMRTRLAFSLVVGLLAVARVAGAGEPTDVLKSGADRVLRLLEQPGDRRAEMRKVADELFDFEEMSRRALGPHWKARTPAEQAEFVRLFADLLERSYIGRVESGRGGSVRYTGESAAGDEATVRTRIVTSQGTEVPADYRMHRRNGRWQIYDVSIEGVSLVSNYRSQFNSVIQSQSYSALLERLRSKEPDAAASPSSPRRAPRN